MLKLIKELFILLTPKQRRQFYTLQLLVVIMAMAEIVGVASIAPFMALVGDPSVLDRENLISYVYKVSGLNKQDYMLLIGGGVLFMLFLASLISIVTTWYLAMFSARTGIEIGDRLYEYYVNQPWLFHSSGSSAQLTKNIANESGRVTNQIIRPLMQINAKIIMVFFMSIGLLIYDPKVAVSGLVLIISSYLLLYRLIRKKISINGGNLSKVATQRYQLMNEGFGGIKDTLLLGRQADFVSRFRSTGRLFSYSMGNNTVIGQVPRYFMELLAFGSMIGMVLYLLSAHDSKLGLVLPILSVYALSAFKLLPAFQLIYNSVTQIRGALSAFYAIRDDLIASSKNELPDRIEKETCQGLEIKGKIELRNILFTYPGKNKPALVDLNINIDVNSTVGIVGSSGAGKSTVIDILLALISPSEGELIINGQVINELNKRAWQNEVGFVPQSIFLSEGTVMENVAFGIPVQEIDMVKVKHAIKLAHLDSLVESLEYGVHTKVGERGVQLSGGQRQRIGIARALYNDAKILVFDEATSALDGITEKMIMSAISDFNGKKTIVMIAHRLSTVKKCDQIYFMENGYVVSKGSYADLIKNNSSFKKMADNS
ncbi:ABC transporter ATP-binding protein [Marinomonas sp. A79]|uniref:ABC transporter ATP-binding protein n=1 Tax=Marinomonas vulgaris TaxID=2823372 RepID=A0ABS5H794_9GAMM|nr:ABC transporter ATP-binding protein [Marinomonas vulgaris]MBR7887586.1 ABC transporter ATP-binding protein [Marinomonas vulgaris]